MKDHESSADLACVLRTQETRQTLELSMGLLQLLIAVLEGRCLVRVL